MPKQQVASFPRVAWTGGDSPSKETIKNKLFRQVRLAYFREDVGECGGLDLWACAGTSALERARIFWGRATADAWAYIRELRREDVSSLRRIKLRKAK